MTAKLPKYALRPPRLTISNKPSEVLLYWMKESRLDGDPFVCAWRARILSYGLLPLIEPLGTGFYTNYIL